MVWKISIVRKIAIKIERMPLIYAMSIDLPQTIHYLDLISFMFSLCVRHTDAKPIHFGLLWFRMLAKSISNVLAV